ncbi:MAG: hypothetical protein WD749_00255 [Phycisphaerales bacterium]
MTATELRDALAAEPFRPFRLRFGSGKIVEVVNPGLVAVSATGRTAVAYKPRGDGWDVIDVPLVEALECPEERERRKRNGRKH